jgi:hypothetical protein
MLRLRGRAARLCDGFTRRDVLRLGALGPLGLSLPQLLRADDAQPTGRARAKSCILFFLEGGQSQLDTFDPKPLAPAAIRGDFRPIATSVPGVHFTEHLPQLATLAHRFTLIRSMSHRIANHNPATYYALTGMAPARDLAQSGALPDDYPNPGCVMSQLLPQQRPVPPFVQLSRSLVGDAERQTGGQNAGFLSPALDPLKVTGDPDDPDFDVREVSLPEEVTTGRMDDRRGLLQAVDRAFAPLEAPPELERMSAYYRRAYQLVTSPDTRQAFAVQSEPSRVRDRYGRNRYGQSLLLARRLVEAGVRLVTVYWGGPLNDPDTFWDTHKDNFPKQRDVLLPPFDQCLSALLEDLQQRGLLETTLVLSMGEFGRTPRIGTVNVNAGTDATGRDHWPYCYTILAAGGGVRRGAIVGRSDATTSSPAERPVNPEDLVATLYEALGVDPQTEIHDRLGRPQPATRGQPVRELFE